MEDIDGGLHPAVDGQSLDDEEKLKLSRVFVQLGFIALDQEPSNSCTVVPHGKRKRQLYSVLGKQHQHTVEVWTPPCVVVGVLCLVLGKQHQHIV